MKALKGIVILMSVVLVVGFAALVYMWQQKREHRAEQAQAKTASEAPALAISSRAPAPLPEPVDVTVDVAVTLPAGARVVNAHTAGQLLDVLVENRDGSRDLYQVARRDGSIRGIIRFREEGP